MTPDTQVNAIWRNPTIPIVFRQSDMVRVRLPYGHHREVIRRLQRRKKFVWDAQYKCWNLPKTRFNEVVTHLLHHFLNVWVIQPYSEKEICAPACWKARGHLCECSCLGTHHGQGHPDGNWFVVSETLAIREKSLGCKLLRKGELT